MYKILSFMVFSLMVSGCASLSEFNRGCRTGLNEMNRVAETMDFEANINSITNDEKDINAFCDSIERAEFDEVVSHQEWILRRRQ